MTDQPLPDDVTALAERYRAGIIARDKAVQRRLIAAYREMYARLQDKINLLLDEISQAAKPMTDGQIVRLARYKNLMSSIESEVSDYSVILRNELSQSARAEVAMAVREARHIIVDAVIRDGGVIDLSAIQALNPRVVETLLGFLDPGGALWKRIDDFPEWTAKKVSSVLINGIGTGKGPEYIAREITRSFGGALTDAMRMTRTVGLWSYREASRATYAANSDIVTGWMWNANLDGLTCPSCIAMHGKTFPLDEPLNDHYNGRCYATPVTILNPDRQIESGEEWLKKQPEAVQRKALGKGRYEAWRYGETKFSDLVSIRDDPVYGSMRTAAPLWEFLGSEPPIRGINA